MATRLGQVKIHFCRELAFRAFFDFLPKLATEKARNHSFCVNYIYTKKAGFRGGPGGSPPGGGLGAEPPAHGDQLFGPKTSLHNKISDFSQIFWGQKKSAKREKRIGKRAKSFKKGVQSYAKPNGVLPSLRGTVLNFEFSCKDIFWQKYLRNFSFSKSAES